LPSRAAHLWTKVDRGGEGAGDLSALRVLEEEDKCNFGSFRDSTKYTKTRKNSVFPCGRQYTLRIRIYARSQSSTGCTYQGTGQRYMVRILEFIAVCLLIPVGCRAVELYDNFPEVIHVDERYVIYSHGLIVEGNEPKPISPKYGQYDFPGIKQALFGAGGFNLIAYQRPKNADFEGYVETLKSWVKRLLDAGVSPHRITLVGFSRGGQTTSYASSDLAADGINTALLAICKDGDFGRDPPLILGGNLVSIYETSDELGSCAKLAARSHLTSFKEVAIATGRGHGAFFQPLPEWMRPLKSWIAKTNR
jgi:hypothetical protein